MPGLTNFPNGVSSFGIGIFGSQLGGQPLTGQVLFVDTTNGVDAGSGNGPGSAAYQTLTYALQQASAGATIFVNAGATITISSATSLLLSTAGVTIIGQGSGAARPRFNFTTANTATIPVSAANVSVINFRHTANFLSIAKAYTVTAAGFTLDNCEFADASGVLNFLAIVNATGAANTADNMTLTNNVWRGLGTTSVTSFLVTANDINGLTLINNKVILARTATAAVLATVTAGVLTNLIAQWNVGISQQTADTGGAFINVGGTTSTGVVSNNYLGDLSTTDLFMTTSVGVTFFNNYKTGVISASGYLLPAADS